MTVDAADLALDYHLGDAEILVLYRPMGEVRACHVEMGMSRQGIAAVVRTGSNVIVPEKPELSDEYSPTECRGAGFSGGYDPETKIA